MKRKIVPDFWRMQQGSMIRAKAWLAWRTSDCEMLYDDLLRDGSYDLFSNISTCNKKRCKLFKKQLDMLLEQDK